METSEGISTSLAVTLMGSASARASEGASAVAPNVAARKRNEHILRRGIIGGLPG